MDRVAAVWATAAAGASDERSEHSSSGGGDGDGDLDGDAGERLARLYSRVEVCFSRTCMPDAGKKQLESSYSRVRRLLALAKVLSTTDLDLMLLPWKARRHRAGSGFNHFLDLVIVLAARLYPQDADGAEAVSAVLDTLAAVKM